MLEQLFGIQYTTSVKVVGTPVVIGYYLDGHGNADVYRITPTGNVALGTTPVAFPHVDSVRAYVATVSPERMI